MPRAAPKGTMPACSDRARKGYAKKRTCSLQPPSRSDQNCSERSNDILNDSLLPGTRNLWSLLWTERKPAFRAGMRFFPDHVPPSLGVTGHFGIASSGFLILHPWVLT